MSVEVTIISKPKNEVVLATTTNRATVAASPSLSSNIPVAFIAQGNIIAGRLAAIINDRAVVYDVRQADHAYALAGVAISSAIDGGLVLVQDNGLVNIPGWGLQPGQQYRAGLNGQIITGPEATTAVFSHIIGRAVSSSALQLNYQSIIFH